jgi:hypothetical protein
MEQLPSRQTHAKQLAIGSANHDLWAIAASRDVVKSNVDNMSTFTQYCMFTPLGNMDLACTCFAYASGQKYQLGTTCMKQRYFVAHPPPKYGFNIRALSLSACKH